MSLGFSGKGQILLQEGVKSETRKCSDPHEAGEVNFSSELCSHSASFVDRCFLECGLFSFIKVSSLEPKVYTNRCN